MQSENTHTRETAAIAAVISNVERLIKDAELLLSDGSSGSSMSLAILAFEEAGKGLIIKMGIEQPASVRSRHEFRHAISLIMLTIALTQKYGVDIVDTTVKLQARLGKEITKKNGRIIIPIITNSLKDEIARDLKPSIEKISPDNITFLQIEFRWLKHIGELVFCGGLEKLRQSGLYVDTDDKISVTSTPESIKSIEAWRWIWAAGRVLNLLKSGTYDQSYSPLSDIIAAAAGGDPEAIKILEIVSLEEGAGSAQDKPGEFLRNLLVP